MSKAAKLVDEMLGSNVPSEPDLIRTLEEAVESDPGSADMRLLLAMSLSKDPSTIDRSISYFEDILADDAFSVDALYGLALALYSKRDFDASRKCCERLYRICPDNTQARDLHDAVVHRQQKMKKQKQKEAAQVGTGVAIGLGVMAGAFMVARALSKK